MPRILEELKRAWWRWQGKTCSLQVNQHLEAELAKKMDTNVQLEQDVNVCVCVCVCMCLWEKIKKKSNILMLT